MIHHSDAARDTAMAQKAADRAQREVLEMQQQQLPKTKADFQVRGHEPHLWSYSNPPAG
jgi:hypothetical protein